MASAHKGRDLKGVMQGYPRSYRWQAAEDNVFIRCRETFSGGNWATNKWNAVVSEPASADINAVCRRRIPHFRPIPFDKIGRIK